MELINSNSNYQYLLPEFNVNSLQFHLKFTNKRNEEFQKDALFPFKQIRCLYLNVFIRETITFQFKEKGYHEIHIRKR